VGFTSYIYLLTKTTPSLATTYAYVNPVVALFLGWFLAGETLSREALIASGVILFAIVLIITSNARASGTTDSRRKTN
jgi:drug/metabolite transporter (DMT)-like permease